MKSILLFAIFISYCVTAATFDAEVFLKKFNIKQWSQLSTQQQAEAFELIEYSGREYKIESYEVKINMDAPTTLLNKAEATSFFYENGKYITKKLTLNASQQAWVLQNIKSHYENYIGEVDNQAPNVTTVAEPSATITLYLLEGEILAGHFSFFQYGAYNENIEYGNHFTTEADAKAAGWDTSADVSWSNHFLINQQGEFLSSNGYWQWSGW